MTHCVSKLSEASSDRSVVLDIGAALYGSMSLPEAHGKFPV